MDFSVLNSVLSYVIFLNILLGMAIIFLERRSAATTWAWLMILTFIPVLGFILYVVLGQNLSRKKIFQWDEAAHTRLEREVNRQMDIIRMGVALSGNVSADAYRELIYMNLKREEALYSEDNEVRLFVDGHDKFEALLQDLNAAQKHIHLLYYIIRSDGLGTRVADVLAAKAREGVEVRVLYDESGSRWLSSRLIKKIKSAGGEMVPFFPAKIPFFNFNLNYRNHRKLAIIDGQTGYIGGFNIGDEYLGLKKKFGYWRDTHLRIQGSAVNSIQTRFLLDWNQASRQALPFLDFCCVSPGMPGGTGIQIVTSGPDSEWEQIKNAHIKLILSAKKYVYMQTPYFIPDDSILDALKIASSSGIDVRIMVPSIPDQPFVYWATQSYLGELLKSGVRVYKYRKGFLHAKTMAVDRLVASVGTANMDVRSFRLNFESNAFLYDEQLAGELTRQFLTDVEHSEELTLEGYNRRPLRYRFRESVSRLLSPIL
jgi:cardiolipin synthase A/B